MRDKHKIIVLDDDPTGTQTVKGVPVLTVWDVAVLESAMLDHYPLFFILTNTRAFSAEEATRITLEIGENIRISAQRTGISFTLVSRGDSTLRGHFPEEPAAIEQAFGQPYDAWFIIPFFAEGSRVTKNDIHFIVEGEKWVPVAETPFARDPVLGFHHSNLRLWIEEKTGGRVRARDVISLSLDELENDTEGMLLDKLLALKDRRMVVVNATKIGQLRRLVKITACATANGKYFLYRTASSWVKVLLEQATGQIMDDIRFDPNGNGALVNAIGTGGLIVVGSYVPNTTAQINYLLEKCPSSEAIEISALAVTRDASIDRFAAPYAERIDALLLQNKNILLYTSRQEIQGETPEESQKLILRISAAVSEVVRQIKYRPAWLIAKGGITSSTIATHSLGMKRALVVGTLLPGVPVWLGGQTSRYPGMIYVVFPGNVGQEDSLWRAMQILTDADLAKTRQG